MSRLMPLIQMRRQWHEAFPELFDESDLLPGMLGLTRTGLDSVRGKAWSPPVDILETNEAYEVRLAVPGYTQKDITLEVEGKVLMVFGQALESSEQDDDSVPNHRVLKQEILSGAFTRKISFPCDLDGSQAKAHFEHGVLTITLPKAAQSKKQLIPIE